MVVNWRKSKKNERNEMLVMILGFDNFEMKTFPPWKVNSIDIYREYMHANSAPSCNSATDNKNTSAANNDIKFQLE